MRKQVDILIIGGGLIGSSLLIALKSYDLKLLLIDSTPNNEQFEPNFDTRSIALSSASIRILDKLGLWPSLKPFATSIASINVSQQGRFGKLDFQKSATESLGYVAEIHALNQSLQLFIPEDKILRPAKLVALKDNLATIEFQKELIEIEAKLIVAADGTNSSTRALAGLNLNLKDYKQQAIVANIGLKRSHNHQAFERFTQTGLIAMLPLSENRCSMIWALPAAEAANYMNLSEAQFLNILQEAFGYRLGRFVKLGKRLCYPLTQAIMPKQAAWPLVFIGNAAHTLHPVAGQGFNLGLRDVASLAQCILSDGLSQSMLDNYLRMRSYDQSAIKWLTKALSQLFSIPGLSLFRSLGLISMDNLPMFKSLLAKHAAGFAGQTPDLACNIPLKEEHETIL